MSMAGVLCDRALLSISGADTRSFLQGLITHDVEQLSANKPLYSALLTPQGKILFDFLLFEWEGMVLVDCWKPARENLQKRLSMYRLRAKVEISPRDDLAVNVAWEGSTNGATDPRLSGLGTRSVTNANKLDDSSSRYLDHRLDLGVPEGRDFGQDKVFALEGDLDELHAISFEKGCYVGQELTARMKHRGTARKRLLPVASTNGILLPPPDTSLTAGGHDIGTLTSTYGSRGFALLRLDRLEDAKDATIDASGTPVNVTKPRWLFA